MQRLLLVFMLIPDPVGAGFVENLARPGGNLTGFAVFEYGFGTKYVELLKEIAPRVTRVAVLRDSATTSGTGQFAAIQAVAPSFGLEVIPLNVRDGGEIAVGVADGRLPALPRPLLDRDQAQRGVVEHHDEHVEL